MWIIHFQVYYSRMYIVSCWTIKFHITIHEANPLEFQTKEKGGRPKGRTGLLVSDHEM